MQPYLSVREAAALARVSSASLYGAIKRGELRHSRIPPGRRNIRIEPSAVYAWLAQFETPPRD